MSPEGRRILPHLTVEENLMLGAYIRNDKEGIAQDIDWVYNLFPRLRERSWQKGGTLSGGEKQRISIARAILKNAPIIILDEATANIDTETELLIQDSMEKMKNIGTMLIVAHRLSTIQHADEIIVLSHGKIVEHGTHQELLAAQGRYYQLYTLQYHREQSEKQRGRK